MVLPDNDIIKAVLLKCNGKEEVPVSLVDQNVTPLIFIK